MLEGTFYVDESANLLYVWPPSGTDMSTATVEAGTESTLFTINNKSEIRGAGYHISIRQHLSWFGRGRSGWGRYERFIR